VSQSNGPLRIGTRASALARWQAEWVAAQLANRQIAAELVLISTRGDMTQQPLTSGGGQGLFTKEIQRALLDHRVDLAVHSLKDLPTAPVPGLVLAAVPIRESHRDVLVSRAGILADLPAGAVVGTGSRRRESQLLHVRPDIRVAGIRGNVETRLSRLDTGEYDAILLAEAGIKRLGFDSQITQILPEEIMLPAAGQGALAIECRADDRETQHALRSLDDPATHAAVRAERALLSALQAGCLAPAGAWGRVGKGGLELDGVVLSVDGRQRLAAHRAGPGDDPEQLGALVAGDLLGQGAAALIADAR
jgi:hydroxymethylbilane synthase